MSPGNKIIECQRHGLFSSLAQRASAGQVTASGDINSVHATARKHHRRCGERHASMPMERIRLQRRRPVPNQDHARRGAGLALITRAPRLGKDDHVGRGLPRQPLARQECDDILSPAASHSDRMHLRHGPSADNQLQLDRCVERQHGHTDRAARMPSGVAKDIAQQLARSIANLRLAGEVRGARHETSTLITWAIASRSPASAATAASAFSAAVRAQSAA